MRTKSKEEEEGEADVVAAGATGHSAAMLSKEAAVRPGHEGAWIMKRMGVLEGKPSAIKAENVAWPFGRKAVTLFTNRAAAWLTIAGAVNDMTALPRLSSFFNRA